MSKNKKKELFVTVLSFTMNKTHTVQSAIKGPAMMKNMQQFERVNKLPY